MTSNDEVHRHRAHDLDTSLPGRRGDREVDVPCVHQSSDPNKLLKYEVNERDGEELPNVMTADRRVESYEPWPRRRCEPVPLPLRARKPVNFTCGPGSTRVRVQPDASHGTKYNLALYGEQRTTAAAQVITARHS